MIRVRCFAVGRLPEFRMLTHPAILIALASLALAQSACSGHAACAPDCAKSPTTPVNVEPADPATFQALYGEEVAPPNLLEPPADAKRTASGLVSQVINPGTGDLRPSERDQVTFHFTGWGPEGQRFASTFGADPRTTVVAQLAPGWAEGIQLMRQGERRRFWIPELLARSPDMVDVPDGDIVLEVELIELLQASDAAPPPPPEDVASPPPHAKKTASGVQYIEIRAGQGDRKPASSEVVKVRYTGWTGDGQMFDSSYTRGLPAKFRVDEVIAGWTEVLQLMTPGAQWRVWIPAELAYGESPQAGQPAGDLTFEIELLEIL